MKNAHLRFGWLTYVMSTEKAVTNIRVRLDRLIGEVLPDPPRQAKAHFLSLIGGDTQISAVAAAISMSCKEPLKHCAFRSRQTRIGGTPGPSTMKRSPSAEGLGRRGGKIDVPGESTFRLERSVTIGFAKSGAAFRELTARSARPRLARSTAKQPTAAHILGIKKAIQSAPVSGSIRGHATSHSDSRRQRLSPQNSPRHS
ncbi:MAG TPA: hypothetical protein VMG82_00690 [Candidatus Sulfotelmatobacter sp.]|nr:hypothetical protein [Candidatus Sulfotelmatobacter sp.]